MTVAHKWRARHWQTWMLRRRQVTSKLLLWVITCALLELMPGIDLCRWPAAPTALARAAEFAQADDKLAVLTPGKPVARVLAAREVHGYQVALAAGQYFHALIEQHGIDASVTLTAPAGQTLLQLDCRQREPTPISFIAHAAGTYRLAVRSRAEDAQGRYELRVDELRPATTKDNYQMVAAQAYAEGEQLLKEGAAEASRLAINKYQAAAAAWHEAGAAHEEAHALKRIGDIYQSFGEVQPASSYYKQALSISRRTVDLQGEGETINGLAYVQLTLGQNQKALALCTRALRLGQTSNNRQIAAQALNNIGEIQYGLGNLQRSIDYFQQALPRWRAAGDRPGQALALLNLGYTYSDLGQTREAFDSYNQALALWQAVGDRRGEATTLIAIGRLYLRIGESQTALDLFNRALPLIQRVGDTVEEAIALGGLGDVYRYVGEQQRALAYYQRIVALFHRASLRAGEASTLGIIGKVYYDLDNHQQALEYDQRALAIFRAIADQRMELFILKQIGQVYDATGAKENALADYRRVLAFEQAERDRREEADTLNLMGRVYAEQARPRQARACYERALALSRAAEYPFGETATLYNLARIELASGNLTAARVRAESALALVESLRTKVASEDLRASYFASVRQLYELDIDLLMALHRQHPDAGYDAAAFEACERARARSLLETLTAARVGVRERAAPELRAREAELRQQLSQKVEQRMQLPASAQADAAAATTLTKEIDELTAQYQEVAAQVRAAATAYTAQSQPQPLSLSEIRARALDGETLLLEFSLGEERSYLWVVAQDAQRAYELPPRKELEAAAGRVRSLLVAPAQAAGETFTARQARLQQAETDYWREAHALSEMLLGPAAASLGTKRLLIVADGALQYLPFSALPVPRQTGAPVPLLVEHEITYQPSASTLATLRGLAGKRPPTAKAVAVFADPVFEADDGRLARTGEASAQQAAAARETELHQALRDLNLAENGSIPRLRASSDEAEAIMQVAPGAMNLKAVGFDADKPTATSAELSQYRIIHFATHGVLDSEHPELSGLLLSRFDRTGRPKEGFLRLDDIYNLNLPADLVVLSACNTGLGKEIKGEGLVGLVRGFMYAGSTRVVASLWKVDDDATAELMTRFYRAMLEEQQTPAAALRAAQVAMWRERRWHAPYYWAAFVLQGEYAGKIEIAHGGHVLTPWLAGGAVALIIALVGLYGWRRRRKKKMHALTDGAPA